MPINPAPASLSASMSRRAGALLAALALGASACSAVGDVVDGAQQAIEDGVDAAREAGDLIKFCTAAVRVAQAVEDEDLEAAVNAGTNMLAEAPAEIHLEAEIVLDGATRARDGDRAALGTQEFQDAAKAVRNFTADRCDPR
ncbi:MAG: hypothetical protein ACI867_000578 [Glaciecola sp.]|jgi:hypothetical protein